MQRRRRPSQRTSRIQCGHVSGHADTSADGDREHPARRGRCRAGTECQSNQCCLRLGDGVYPIYNPEYGRLPNDRPRGIGYRFVGAKTVEFHALFQPEFACCDNAGGEAIGECSPFVVGTTWGSVRYADVYLGGEVARNVPIQDIGDQPGGGGLDISRDCANYGIIQDTQSQLGANGILGIGPFPE